MQAWTYLQEPVARAAAPEADAARRQHDRRPCNGCLPIQLRILDEQGEPLSGWHPVDPLDFSLGGCCLMLPMGEIPALDRFMPLELAVSAEAGFAQPQFRASLRWFVNSGLVTILGIAYDEPLASLPPHLFGSV